MVYGKYSPSYLVYIPDNKKVMKFGTVSFKEKYQNANDLKLIKAVACSENFLPFFTFDTFDTPLIQ